MRMKKVLLIFLVILFVFFIINSLYCKSKKIVILSGQISKIECSIMEYDRSEYVSTKGTGIITFFEPESSRFAAIGHCINKENDVIEGNIYYSKISNITKSKNGEVGCLYSNKKEDYIIGDIKKNNELGVFGYCQNSILGGNKIEVMEPKDIIVGNASLFIDFGDSSKKEYDIKITEVYSKEKNSNSCFMIEIIDDELLQKTGGIVKGMSGSPIIQDGKLVGALTKVTSDDVTKGYGIFADIMIEQCENM